MFRIATAFFLRLYRRPAADLIIGRMTLLAAVDPWYVVACTAVPILWGAVVHGLFDVWRRRRAPRAEPPPGPLDAEVQEANLP